MSAVFITFVEVLDAIDLQLVTDSPEVVLPRDAAVLVACALQDLPDMLAQAWDEGRRIGLTQADEAAYIAAVNPAVVLGLVAEIERLTGEPTEDEVEVGAREIWRWFVGSNLDGFYRHAYAYDREKCMDACRAALRAARGLS